MREVNWVTLVDMAAGLLLGLGGLVIVALARSGPRAGPRCTAQGLLLVIASVCWFAASREQGLVELTLVAVTLAVLVELVVPPMLGRRRSGHGVVWALLVSVAVVWSVRAVAGLGGPFGDAAVRWLFVTEAAALGLATLLLVVLAAPLRPRAAQITQTLASDRLATLDQIGNALGRVLGDPNVELRPVGDGAADSRPAVLVRNGDDLVGVRSVVLARSARLVAPVERTLSRLFENQSLAVALELRVTELRHSAERLARADDLAQRQLLRRLELHVLAPLQDALTVLDPHTAGPVAMGPRARRVRERLGEAGEALVGLTSGMPPSSLSVRELPELLAALWPGTSPSLVVRCALVEGHVSQDALRTLWFVCAEGVANAVKHAGSSRVWLSVDEVAGLAVPAASDAARYALRVRVSDDGAGGADESGSGLCGLLVRTEGVGGSFRVGPRQPRGTTLEAFIPC